MIELSDELKQSLLDNSVHREIIIRFPNAADGEITEIGSSNIIADSFELTQSICDEKEFILGGCIAGQLTIQVIGIEQELNNRRINVFLKQTYGTGDLVPSEDLCPSEDLYPGLQKSDVEVQLFSGTIDSSLRQKNRAVKEIIAYDDLYKATQIYAYNYFTGLSAYSPNTRLGDIRYHLINSFIDYEYDDEFTGFNDNNKLSLSLDLVKSVCNEKLTIADLLTAYCELNACFAVMGGDGRIKFIQLINPSSESFDYYSDLSFEEYETRPINIVKFYYNKDKNFSYGFGTEKQSWYISENTITKCCTDISKLIMAFNDNAGRNYMFYDLYKYRPFSADIYARWWIEPGDKVEIKTGYTDTETVESFVFSRTIKGINGMRVTIKANGTEYLGKEEMKTNE